MNAKRSLPLLMSTLVVATAASFAVPTHAQVFNKYFVEGSSGAYHTGYKYNVWGTGDPLGGSIYGIPNFNGTSSTFSGSTTDTTGRATSFVANTYWTAPNGLWTTAIAGADLATASVRASVTSSINDGGAAGGQAVARAHDILHFTVAGAEASTRTRVKVEYSIDGRMTNVNPYDPFNGPYAAVSATLCMNLGTSFGCGAAINGDYQLSAQANIDWGNANNRQQVVTTSQSNRSDVSDVWGTWTSTTPELMTFTGSFDLLGSSITLSPDFQLRVACQLGAQCEYGNTGKFRFVDLASNVSFTSDSGVFLANMSPVSAVPEPETYTLMMASLSLMGWVARRRKS
jgi:PEP-CTERM motif